MPHEPAWWRRSGVPRSRLSLVAAAWGCLSVGQRVTPQFRMTDWRASRAFYEAGLGFAVEWEHTFEPGLPVFAKLSLDGLGLFLTEHAGDCAVGGAAYFVVDDVDALYAAWTARGVVVAEAPETAPWQAREMLVIDPDGNRLRFAGAVPD